MLGKSTPPLFAAIALMGTLPALADGHGGCETHKVTASAVHSREDIKAFVDCAAEYLSEHGTVESRRAFHEDERWKHGSIYVFVDGISTSGKDAITYVYPPDPSREGRPWGETIDDFGTDLYYEIFRMMEVVNSGWTYYSILNPETGGTSLKVSYLIEVDWDGNRAVIGAGIYEPDLPSTCLPDEVNAAGLSADPAPDDLAAFVRCAAMKLEVGGYSALDEITSDPRWGDGMSYVYVMDLTGNQLMTGSKIRINGIAPDELGRKRGRMDQFGGRDMVGVGDAFGEAYIYYRRNNPTTGMRQAKLGFLKRVVAHGVPLIVGSGYFLAEGEQPAPETSCSEHFVTAGAIDNRYELEGFVQCAAEYIKQHGPEEARRAFNEDERWKQGQIYVFVDEVQPSGEDAVVHVFPPEPSREGSVWGTSIDSFGTDYYFELDRILSLVDSGWIYYAFANPETGLRQPKSSYVKAVDWNGSRSAVGAGFYAPDLPGACDASEVSAAALEATPSPRRLQEFVRCAAMQVEASGRFAGPALESDPRWNHGSIYPFVINESDGTVLFSSNPASFEYSGRLPDLFDGRDAVSATATFGEVFWYYGFTNPSTGLPQTKISFVKRVVAQGMPLLVGAGYNP